MSGDFDYKEKYKKMGGDKLKMGKYCEKCKKVYSSDNMKFCRDCGSKLVDIRFEENKTAEDSSKNQYTYHRPEKVRFSEQWLLIKMVILSILLNVFWTRAFSKGLVALDLAKSIVLFGLAFLFVWLLYNNYKDYAGNPYMQKFSIKDETIVSACNAIYTVSQGIEALFIILWIGIGCANIKVFGFWSLHTWVAKPAYEVGSWIGIPMLLIEVIYFIAAHRPEKWALDNHLRLFEDEE